MKNIIKENKELHDKNNALNIRINELQKERFDEISRIEEAYQHSCNQKIEFMKYEYKTKINRKKEVEKIVKLLEIRLKDKIKIFDEDLTEDIENYIKLLDFLKKE